MNGPRIGTPGSDPDAPGPARCAAVGRILTHQKRRPAGLTEGARHPTLMAISARETRIERRTSMRGDQRDSVRFRYSRPLRVALATSVLSILPVHTAIASPVRGQIVYDGRGCSWYAIETPSGYTMAESHAGGASNGDTVVGELYGLQELYVLNRDMTLLVWIDDFALSKNSVISRLARKGCR
jgi:hypothetical protein